MTITKEQAKGQEFLQTLVTKAWESAEFKEQLIVNPVDTIEKVTGEKINLKNEQRIVVEDQMDLSTIFLNIPRKVELDSLELTDEQLELASGGEVAATAGVVLAVVGLFAAGVAIGQADK